VARPAAIVDVRGAGLMRGIELDTDAAGVVAAALDAGLLVNRTAERVVRLLPPLTVSSDELSAAVSILDDVLRHAVTDGHR
jgi:acetylornithine/succinyldiaminopimelate/putrescine aminotransferase